MKKEKNLELDFFNLSEEILNKIMQEDLTQEQIKDIAKEELTLQVGDIVESLLEEYETSDKKGKDEVVDALIGLVLGGYLEEDCECEEENGVEIDTSDLNNYTLDEEKFAEGLTDISHLAGMVSGLMSLGLNGENALTGALSLTLAKSDKERDLEIARINA